MTTAQHTPGPWQREKSLDKSDLRRPWVGRIDEMRYTALACGENDAEVSANADLIAAAPDMLAALEAITQVRVQGHDNIWAGANRCREIATAAIAKARGEVA